MPTDVPYRQSDTYPALTATLRDGAGAPIDLTGATTVRFHLRKRGHPTAKVNRPAAIESPAEGKVRVDWWPTDLDQPGVFEADFEIDWGTGTQTVPSTVGDLRIIVTRELA